MSPKFHVQWIGDDNVTRIEHFHIYHRADAFRVQLIYDYEFPPERVKLSETHDSNQILSRAVSVYESMGVSRLAADKIIKGCIKRTKCRQKLGAYQRAERNRKRGFIPNPTLERRA